MSHSELIFYSCGLVLLILLSGFFSSAETGLMAINRYRLRHRARLKKRSAVLILKLLKRPDRLLGMILIGNSFANIFASAITTLLTIYYFGEKKVLVATLALTFVILIFAEVAPKTVAAMYPDRISKIVAWPVFILLKLFYPLVWLTSVISNGLLRLLRVRVSGDIAEPLTRDELRSIVYETTGKSTRHYQGMLLGVLDLNKVPIDQVMVPRHEVIGIDLELGWEAVCQEIAQSQHDWLPVYRENLNQLVGVLHLKNVMAVVMANALSEEKLLKILHEPYFVPEGTPLNVQLVNFQQQRKRIAFVVDEYGEIQGLLTLEDILEEIVGEFTTNVEAKNKKIQPQADGSYLVDGGVTIRELNRATKWQLPMRGPRTLSGLIIEYLESIPCAGTGVLIAHYPMEIVDVEENRVKTARIFPRLQAGAEVI